MNNKLVAEKGLQRAVTAVAEWSTSKKMVLNADKCEVTFFLVRPADPKMEPPIKPIPKWKVESLKHGKEKKTRKFTPVLYLPIPNIEFFLKETFAAAPSCDSYRLASFSCPIKANTVLM